MIIKDIAEYEEKDSNLAKLTITRLHDRIDELTDELDSVNSKMSEYVKRCLEAIEYIEEIMPGLRLSNQMYSYIKKHLLEILKGENNENN